MRLVTQRTLPVLVLILPVSRLAQATTEKETAPTQSVVIDAEGTVRVEGTQVQEREEQEYIEEDCEAEPTNTSTDECEGCFNKQEILAYWEAEDDEDWPEGYQFDWEGYTEGVHDYDHIFEGLDCPDILFDEVRPVHTPETWKKIRQTYIDVMGSEASITTEKLDGNGFQVPIEVKITEEKGRGVYAKEFIPKGTKVYDQHAYTAMFYTGERFRKFLELIDQDLACDVLIWAYVEYKDELTKDQLILAFDMDEASFTNGAVHRSEINVDVDYVAKRDIPPGEELIESYDDFSISGGFESFGM